MLELLVGAVVEVAKEPQDLTLREKAKIISRSAGLRGSEWKCLYEIIDRESSWDPAAENGKHYGLGQIVDGKIYLEGKPEKQVAKTIEYIENRYGTPCKALEFHNRKGWY